MVGIQGLGGVPEPKSEGPGRVRRDREADEAREASASGASTPSQDGVSISEAAKQAAEVARVVQLSRGSSDIRADRVEAARERLERGDYKNPEVVAQVAERLLKFLG